MASDKAVAGVLKQLTDNGVEAGGGLMRIGLSRPGVLLRMPSRQQAEKAAEVLIVGALKLIRCVQSCRASLLVVQSLMFSTITVLPGTYLVV